MAITDKRFEFEPDFVSVRQNRDPNSNVSLAVMGALTSKFGARLKAVAEYVNAHYDLGACRMSFLHACRSCPTDKADS